MNTPRRYRFDQPQMSRESAPLPVQRAAPVVEQHDQGPAPVVVQHFHEAAPDRTLQRVALGAGMGGGAVASAAYFGPMLIAAMASMTAALMTLAVMLAVCAWAIVSVVNAVGGSTGQQAAKTITKTRRGFRRR